MRINFGNRSADTPAGMLSPRMSGFDELTKKASSSKVPSSKQSLVEEKFQDFVGSTFYREMLKALRSGQKHSKYFYGGQAEEIFRGQLDQQISEEFGHTHAQHLAAPLFEAYSRRPPHQPSVLAPRPEAAHALDAVV